MHVIKTEICNFTVPGRAIPAVRMTQRTKIYGRAKRYMAYKNKVSWTERAEFKGEQTYKIVGIELNVYLNGGNQGDIDNYFKFIADAFNKVVYQDDREVKEMIGRKIEDENERVEVLVYEL